MAYTVLARRYRPSQFDEVVGQEPIARTLKSAVASGRAAHAYLFCGTRGIGKTTMARILASALNCEKGPTTEPCGTCDICARIHRGDDVDVLEIDGASNNSVEDVRRLRENAPYRPARARYKIYYIDEVHMLSTSAFNALLKTLEEPPEHVIFLFSTTEPERLPATILSRCQRFDFRAVPAERIAEHLAEICKKEKVKADRDALLAVAREGRGSVRDAMTLLDQAIAVGGGRVTVEAVRDTVGAVSGEKILALLSACADGEAGAALRRFAALLADGADILSLLDQAIRQVRDLLVVKTCGNDGELLDVFGPDPKALAAEAEKVSVPSLVAALGYLTEARSRARWAIDARPVAELALVRMAALLEMELLPEVLARLDSLERTLAGAPAEKKKQAPKVTEGPVPSLSAPLRGTPNGGGPPRFRGGPRGPSGSAVEGVAEEPAGGTGKEAPAAADNVPGGRPEPEPNRSRAKRRKLEEAMNDPLVQKAINLFDGRIVNIEE